MTGTNIPPRVDTSGKAITSMVLGICALVIPYLGIVTGILGVVFGALARKDIRRMKLGGSDLKGNGMAIAGLVTGIIGIVLWVVIIIVVFAVDSGSDPGYYDEYP